MSIRILRSATTATPPSLDQGQLAYSENSGNLFIGEAGAVVTKIGGETDVLKLAGISAGAEVNVVDSVAGKTGTVSIVASDLADFNSSVDTEVATLSIETLNDVAAMTPSLNQVLTWNGSAWNAQASGSGVTDFVSLNDTPANFTGSGSFFVKVNAGATALEYVQDIDDGTF